MSDIVKRARTGMYSGPLTPRCPPLSYTEILSPIAGRIGRKGVEAGQRLQPGQPLLAIVEDDLWVIANYKETQLTRMKPGQPVEIKIDSFPDHTFRGYIESMSPGRSLTLVATASSTLKHTRQSRLASPMGWRLTVAQLV